MRYLDVLNLEEAQKEIDTYLSQRTIIEVDIKDSIGAQLVEDIYSNIDVPSFNKSSVDGYAIDYKDSTSASENSPVILKTIDKYRIGEENLGKITSGLSQYVVTGGMIPSGCSAVVKIEDVELFGENILVKKSLSNNQNIIAIGEDFSKGKLVFEKNRILTIRDISLLASLGISKVSVYKPITAVVISTGNELLKYDQALEPAKIFDVNSLLITKSLARCNINVVDTVCIHDDYDTILNKLLEYDVDLYITSGGSSKGDEDYTAKIFEELTKNVICHGINIKPGKPTVIAKTDSKLYLGLPGNPVSAFIVLNNILLNKLSNLRTCQLVLSENINSDHGKTTTVFVSKNGTKCSPLYYKSSYLNILADADGYFLIPPNIEGVHSGDIVEVILYE